MELDRPTAIVRFLESNPLVRERIRDVHEPLAEAKGAGGRRKGEVE